MCVYLFICLFIYKYWVNYLKYLLHLHIISNFDIFKFLFFYDKYNIKIDPMMYFSSIELIIL